MRRLYLVLLTLLLSVPLTQAEVTLSSLYSDHMVLQRDQANYLWGWADAGEAISVSFDGQTLSTTTGENGGWHVILPAAGLGDPKTITVQGKNTITVSDILMGDVWVCSGQSNMVWTVQRCKDAETEIAHANYPNIRYFRVPWGVSPTEQTNTTAQWVLTSPEVAGGFSAVAYYFGRELHLNLDVPIGLIGTAWGGTTIESWISQRATELSETFSKLNNAWKPDVEKSGDAIVSYYEKVAYTYTHPTQVRVPQPKIERRLGGAPNVPSFNYNAMIAPLWRFGITGTIWYQGESNAERAYQYRDLMQTMIIDWRKQFGQGEFPFIITQLANYKERAAEPSESDWAELREAQSMAAAEMENVGIATIIDIGDAKDIHPKNKQDVGYRLAQSALNIAYDKDVLPAGPTYKSMKIKGDKIVLSFDYVGKGLVANGDSIKGFAIAGADQKFVWADTKIKGSKVVVSSVAVQNPVAVRYGWANNPECNLSTEKIGSYCYKDHCERVTITLPASPFRTDDFPMLTRDAE